MKQATLGMNADLQNHQRTLAWVIRWRMPLIEKQWKQGEIGTGKRCIGPEVL
jgi:hypothetical protein